MEAMDPFDLDHESGLQAVFTSGELERALA